MRIPTTVLRGAALLLAVALLSLIGSPLPAADTGWLARKALKAKILREAGDRYNVRFLSMHIDRLKGGDREVTGRGRFNRKSKNSQEFSYHTIVNLYDNSDRETSYTIR